MDTQNVTLSVPKHLLRKAKLIAVERQTSLSGLLVELLANLVAEDESYSLARKRHTAWLETGANLGTNGKAPWTRDDLHER